MTDAERERAALDDLAQRLETATTGGKLRFSLCQGEGWVTTAKEPTIRLLCDLWNARHMIARALHTHLKEDRP